MGGGGLKLPLPLPLRGPWVFRFRQKYLNV